MTFEEARNEVISAIHFATGALNEKGLAIKLTGGRDVDFSDFKLDSLTAMEMCLEIEEKTGIDIDLGDLAQHSSVNALAEFIVVQTTIQDR